MDSILTSHPASSDFAQSSTRSPDAAAARLTAESTSCTPTPLERATTRISSCGFQPLYGNISPEIENFNEIDPNKDKDDLLNTEAQTTLSEISRDSLIFMVRSIVAIFAQTKIGAYHEIKPYITWLTNFIN